MTSQSSVAVLSELFSGLGFLLSVVFVGLLAMRGESIPSTLMLIIGVAGGSFYALKGASGTVAAIQAAKGPAVA